MAMVVVLESVSMASEAGGDLVCVAPLQQHDVLWTIAFRGMITWASHHV